MGRAKKEEDVSISRYADNEKFQITVEIVNSFAKLVRFKPSITILMTKMEKLPSAADRDVRILAIYEGKIIKFTNSRGV